MKHFIQLLFLGLVPLSLYGQLLITEIADPANNTEGRYIEIYNRSALPVNLSNHKLVRWTNNNLTYTANTAIDLSSMGTLNPGQFLVVGANSTSFNAIFGFTPDLAQGNGPADSNGDDQMAILVGETIIDIFGVPGESGLNTCHDFTDGRAERKPFVLQSNPNFDESQWNVWSNSNPTNCTSHVTGTQTAPNDFDPGHWIGESPSLEDLTISTPVYFESLTLSANKTLTILKSGQLTINGNFNNEGAVVMHSDSDEYSAFTVGGISGNGSYTYNRWTASTLTNDLITAPFAGQAFNDFLNNNSGIINTNPSDPNQNLFGNFNNNTGTYENYSSSSTTIITSGIGYRAGTNSGAPLAFQGQFITTDQSVPISVGSSAIYGRWNLVGNPFPSFIKLDSFLSTNSGVLDPDYTAIYAYNGSGWTVYNNANSTGKLIAPGQGFFLASASEGGNVFFTKSALSTSVSDDFIAGEMQEPDTYLKLNISSGNDNFSSEIYLNPNSSLGMDTGYDAGLFAEQTPQICLYSHLANSDLGLKLAIQSIPKELTDTVVIPLGVNTIANTSVSIGLDSDVVLNSLHVYLEDSAENNWIDLGDHYYNFSTSTDLQGAGRFFLHISRQALSRPQLGTSSFRILSALGHVTVQGAFNVGDFISFHDLQGRMLLERLVTESRNQITIETSKLALGLYLIQIKSNQGTETYKVLVK